MNIVKLSETVYQAGEITDSGVELVEQHFDPNFKTISELKEFIKDDCDEKYYVLYKTTIKREVIKVISQEEKPCTGGWRKGHSPENKDDKETWCYGCGYKLKMVYKGLDRKFILVQPLQHRDDSHKLLSIVNQLQGVVKN